MMDSATGIEELATRLTSAGSSSSSSKDSTNSDPARRRALAKSITLIESTHPQHQEQAQALLNRVLPHTGKARRIGISGTPGVGKSTFIEAFGLHLIEQGFSVAVLAVDPSSPIRGGSILGDKTRMEKLSRASQAFIRPSPSSGALGGVAQKTRESMLLCEAAGFDVVLVETVGVGQSEYEVASMVDFFMVLMQPNSGDELQGIKRGIMELADALVINKADGDSLKQAERTKQHCENALHLMRGEGDWTPVALTCSALTNTGLDEIEAMLERFFEQAKQSGSLERTRNNQSKAWLDTLIDQELKRLFEEHPAVKQHLTEQQQAVIEGKSTPFEAAQRLIALFRS
jgi:LAO/AO transport system kinase